MENQPRLTLECVSKLERQPTIDKIQEIAPLANAWIGDFKMYPNGSLTIYIEIERKNLQNLLAVLIKADITVNPESIINLKYEVTHYSNPEESITITLVFSRFIVNDI